MRLGEELDEVGEEADDEEEVRVVSVDPLRTCDGGASRFLAVANRIAAAARGLIGGNTELLVGGADGGVA